MIRALAAILVGLLLTLALVLSTACGGGGGSKPSKTAEPGATGTVAAQTTASPGATSQAGGSDRPPVDGGGQQGGSSGGSVSATPTLGFDEGRAGRARDTLQEMRADAHVLEVEIAFLQRRIQQEGLGGLLPTSVALPTPQGGWYANCCEDRVNRGLRDIGNVLEQAQRLRAIYDDAGKDEGLTQTDKVIAQANASRAALQALSGATNAGSAATPMRNATAAVTAMQAAIQAALDCCSRPS